MSTTNIPREPNYALLRPFIGCSPQELPDAWAAMFCIAKVQNIRAGRAGLATPNAWQTLRDFAEGRINHSNAGNCPDSIEGHAARDKDCPVCQALIAIAVAEPALEAPAARLTKPALVGGGSFGVGVPERNVIEAAQRHYEQDGERKSMTAEEFADEERKRRTLWELIHGPLSTDKGEQPCA